jgi:hypothetical protein
LVAQLRAETPISAYGGHVVWSEPRTGGASFVLVDWVGGVRHVLRVPRRAVPFDVDVGPDKQGRAVAVYSRCQHEHFASNDLNSGQIAYGAPNARNADCDLYEVVLPSGRERKLRHLSTRTASETLPTIWGNAVAFVRVYTHRRGLAGVLPHLYYARGNGQIRQVRGGTRGYYAFHGYLNGYAVADGGPGPLQMDLRGKVLAFSWNSARRACNGSTGGRVGPVVQEIWRVTLGVSRRRVAEACQIVSGDGPSGVYGASQALSGLGFFAEFPTRTPDHFFQSWTPTCGIDSAPVSQVGTPVALAMTDADRFFLMKTGETSFDLWELPLEPMPAC